MLPTSDSFDPNHRTFITASRLVVAHHCFSRQGNTTAIERSRVRCTSNNICFWNTRKNTSKFYENRLSHPLTVKGLLNTVPTLYVASANHLLGKIGISLPGSLRNPTLRLRAAPSPCGTVFRCALPRGRWLRRRPIDDLQRPSIPLAVSL